MDQGYLFLGAVLEHYPDRALPLVYIGSIMLVLGAWTRICTARPQRPFGRLLCRIKPWLMVDVFLIGVLISLVKLMGMADIKMGLSFWAFVGYTPLLIKMISPGSDVLWQRLFGSDGGEGAGSRGERPVVRSGGLSHLRRPRTRGMPIVAFAAGITCTAASRVV